MTKVENHWKNLLGWLYGLIIMNVIMNDFVNFNLLIQWKYGFCTEYIKGFS